jgi:nucleotide-binding universal stress UspA family protein
MHVVDAPLPEWFEEATLLGSRQRQQRLARDFIEAAIKVAEQSTRECGPVEIESSVLHSATVPTLIGISSEAALVVVGYRGHGSLLARSVLGSVSSALVYHAHCPVAVIHSDEAMIGNVARAPVLLGIDGSPASEAATAIAFDEASRRGVGLMALHAWNSPRVTGSTRLIQDSKWDAQLSEEEETLAERLAGWLERYPDVGIRRIVEIGDPARWLIEASERAQLLVVGSHGCSRARGVLLGSVGASVVNRARIPVLVARQS